MSITSLHCENHRYTASASLNLHPAFAGTLSTYPQRDGQAELTWVAGYILKWFTCLQTGAHPSTNRVQCWLTSLMRPTMVPNKPNHHLHNLWHYGILIKYVYLFIQYLNGVVSLSSFTRQHDTVSSIEYGVCNVRSFGTCWPWLLNHTLQHLSCTNHRLASPVASTNHHLLSQKDLPQ